MNYIVDGIKAWIIEKVKQKGMGYVINVNNLHLRYLLDW